MIERKTVSSKIAIFQRKRKPMVALKPGFVSTNGMPPIKVPDGQIYLQKAGAP